MAPNVGPYLAVVHTTNGADRRHIITDDGIAGTTELPCDVVTAAEGWNQWVDRRYVAARQEPHGDGLCIRWSNVNTYQNKLEYRASWGIRSPPGIFRLERQRREFEFEKLRQQREFEE